MAVDTKAQAIRDASNPLLKVVHELSTLSGKILIPIVEGVEISAETITEIKTTVTEEGGLRDQWEAARDSMDAAFLA